MVSKTIKKQFHINKEDVFNQLALQWTIIW